PLCVLTTKANLLLALFGDSANKSVREPGVFAYDSIVQPGGFPDRADRNPPKRFSLIIGNPPWINWDRLSPGYREKTKPLWNAYGLFNLDAKAARHGGAKKELALLMLLRTADRFLVPGGRLAMVLPLSVFRTAKAAEGFRRFHLLPDDTPLRVLRVDDYSGQRPFPCVHSPVATLVLEKGGMTVYPVAYFIRGKDAAIRACRAKPSDPSNRLSAWSVEEPSKTQTGHFPDDPSILKGRVAFLGANAAGASGVFWIEILEKTSRGTLRIRNLADSGKRKVPSLETEIEPDLVYPLLRWRDFARKTPVPSSYMLIPQDAAKRTGIAEQAMRQSFPLTFRYLDRFRSFLLERAAYKKLHRADAAFYSLYNVGLRTFAPVKVVWRRMDRRLRAVLVTEIDDPFLGRRPVVPQETCTILPVRTVEEGRRLVAFLNSEPVQERIISCSVLGGKGFGSPGLLKLLQSSCESSCDHGK
ncbi:MAG TPA: hypothetical protein DEB39_15140, partial [Planctomycetaceae bacterium]|nr:hypothetical protein [Planctomycetaceae bacterium]